MSQQERQWRSKLAQIVAQQGFLRGSIQERQRVCGKPNCKCAKGQKHKSLYLVFSKGGRYQQLYVPRQWEEAVRKWVENYQNMRGLMENVSEMYCEKVRKRQG